MKKVIVLSLVLLLSFLALTSCENKIREDEVVKVSFALNEQKARALSVTNPTITADSSDLTWYYKATKKSATQFATGAKSDWTIIPAANTTDQGKLSNQIEFSRGKWNFELEARNGSAVLYRGSSNDVVVTKQEGNDVQTIQISVSSQVSGSNGSFKVDQVYVKPKANQSGAVTPSKVEYAVKPQQGDLNNYNALSDYTLSDNKYTKEVTNIAPGSYILRVSYIDDGTGGSNATIAVVTQEFTVYSGQQTVIGGYIDEETTSSQFSVTCNDAPQNNV